ncbi:LssY C-terminal domain-containing protein [Haliea sp. E17]|uniref:LssY C-terminal domain-containing protein n=1 Tax=Haliea sp. E17 TaxID=3401576 RepID=UPI003AAB60ED
MALRRARSLSCLLAGLLLAAAGWGQPLPGTQVDPPNDRLQEKQRGSLKVSVAVPSAEETRQIFGVDLYADNVQPVWVEVVNGSDEFRFLTPMGMDPGYYSAREAMSRSRESGGESADEQLERRSINRVVVPPQSTRSGYIFTRVDEGTKSFNVDVVGGSEPYRMSFFVPVPGLKLDHYEVDLQGLYPADQRRELELPALVAALEQFPCCVRDASGEDRGDPLNLVLVGEISDLYYAFMRAGWDETETIYGSSLLKTAASAIGGERYRYSPVSALYVFGRPQDVALQRARSSINERNHLRIWLTPLVHEGKPVWIGQISRDIGVHFTWRTITTHKIDPDVDETREFLLEDMGYSQSLVQFGYVGGVGAAAYDEPRGNLTGDPYFTDGRRMVMWLSGSPTALDEIVPLDLSPYATGRIGD